MCGVLTLPAIHGRNHAPLPKAHHIPLGLGSLFLNAGEREHQLSITELTQVANSDKAHSRRVDRYCEGSSDPSRENPPLWRKRWVS